MKDTTLDWYKENLNVFIDRTSQTDMSQLYNVFMFHVVPGGRIMDLGCGAGKASLYFIEHGFDVLPVDGCKEMCDAATIRTGRKARNLLFDELDYENEFDGIWACASLLHVPKAEMAQVLTLVKNALKDGGIFYASYKYGDTERVRNGRLFSDYTENTMKSLISEVGRFEIMDLWLTGDARPDRAAEYWVNILCRKVG